MNAFFAFLARMAHTRRMPMRRILLLPIALLPGLLAGCTSGQSLAAFVEPGATYQLREIDGKPFRARASLSFRPDGTVRGQAPCNSFAFSLNAPYPWFETGPIRSTRSICPQIREEQHFFKALGTMTLAEASGTVLILQDDTGREMVFTRLPAPGAETPRAGVPVPQALGG